MKSLSVTLYFSSMVIRGVLRASGMCHLGGRAWRLRQAASGFSPWRPARPAAPTGTRRARERDGSFWVLLPPF